MLLQYIIGVHIWGLEYQVTMFKSTSRKSLGKYASGIKCNVDTKRVNTKKVLLNVREVNRNGWCIRNFRVQIIRIKKNIQKSLSNLGNYSRVHPFRTYAKFSTKTNISYLLIGTRTWSYQKVWNVSFFENIAYVLNGWSLTGVRHIFILKVDLFFRILKNQAIFQTIINFAWILDLLLDEVSSSYHQN